MSNNQSFQMPMFASANQHQTHSDNLDIHDIFADYFNEDDGLQIHNVSQQHFHGMGNLSLPTGQGIKTAWHSGSLPVMANSSNGIQPPAAKRIRGDENLFLPTGDQTLGTPGAGQSMVGGISERTSFPSQQHSLNATSGVGALSGRLGFSVTANASGIAMGGGTQQQAMASGANDMSFNAGMGVKVGNSAGNLMAGTGLVVNGMANNGGGVVQWGTIGGQGVSHMQYGMPFQLVDKASIEDQMTAERRMRNREHAKRSRVRKKFMLESLQQQVRGLQAENSTLRMLVQKHIPQHALKIIDDCCSKCPLFGGTELGLEEENEKKTELLKTDFSLIESLTSGQQNFVLSDPRLPDNPIVFASPGFYELTGYTREQVLGRNCRFLQGTGTDPKAVDVIRTAIANGTDATTCVLNYKADGTPFWNQLFVAALRDGDNCIVNYVGVQTMIEPNAGSSALEDKVNAAHPLQIGLEDDDKDIED